MKPLRLLLPEAAAAAPAAAGRGWGWIRSVGRERIAAAAAASSSSSSSPSMMMRGRRKTTTTTTTPRLPFLRPINCSSVSSSTRAPPSMAEPSKLRPEFVARPPVDARSDARSLEERVEKVIYAGRFMTFLGVFGSLMGSILCFLKGCGYVINSFTEDFMSSGKLILMLVEAVDIYLIGTVMLVFGMGLYELFISNLDVAKTSVQRSNLLGLFRLRERPNWLKIESVNELKTKVGHVIVTVLLVGLFEKSKKVTISTPLDLFCFAASILLSSGCLYLLSRLHT
ncbi:uncharacterized protein LOC109727213 [Ananas comosus]|uniref:Uncharacterized protein LOC109727213 n=1 Tax=Ananas comosus TaxID=4615 RepID=A0A6P5H4K2_ANACO|nr:uncharacterized protein LOC109727213 [Ananas comosus]